MKVQMHFQKFAFGVIRIDGVTYEHDVVIDRGEVRKRKKKPSKKFRAEFGHTPISVIDAAATRPVSGGEFPPKGCVKCIALFGRGKIAYLY